MDKMRSRILIAGVVCLCLGLVGGWYGRKAYIGKYGPHLSQALANIQAISEQNLNYKFIAPSLASDLPEATKYGEYQDLKDKVQKVIDDQKKSKQVQDVGFYFRDFNRNQWIGINEDQNFFPASLMKVSVMIAYLKLAEQKPGLLDSKLIYQTAADLNKAETIKPSEYIKHGQSYTIDELIRYMIVDSDNNAMALLVNNIDSKLLQSIDSDLGVELPSTSTDFISAKIYSLYFRILFRSTYLTRDMSEKALKLLSETEFKDGLVEGVSADTAVSHKFGEYEDIQNNQITAVELHDCGVIYYPGHPYLLCIMTKGTDLNNLKKDVQGISSTVYNEIKNLYH